MTSPFQPFGVDIADIIANAWDGNSNSYTLTSISPGVVDPNHASSAPSQVEVANAAQGFVISRKVASNKAQPKGGSVPGTTQSKTGTTVIGLFGNLIANGAIPSVDDVITDDAGNDFVIEEVDGDGSQAFYTCTCRG